jgi:hypothetical protein
VSSWSSEVGCSSSSRVMSLCQVSMAIWAAGWQEGGSHPHASLAAEEVIPAVEEVIPLPANPAPQAPSAMSFVPTGCLLAATSKKGWRDSVPTEAEEAPRD